jgi:AcrR family transcriptional regulator
LYRFLSGLRFAAEVRSAQNEDRADRHGRYLRAERVFRKLNGLTIGRWRVQPWRVDSSRDLTARARIRDAALRRFGEDGFAATTVRRIALDAKVSAGLVVHHFGSKQGLIEACDAYAIEFSQAAQERDAPLEGSGEVLGYLARSMVERAHSTAEMFDEMVVRTEQELDRTGARDSDDPKLRAAVIVSLELGGYAMRTQLARYLGVDPASRQGFERLGEVIAEVLMKGLYK